MPKIAYLNGKKTTKIICVFKYFIDKKIFKGNHIPVQHPQMPCLHSHGVFFGTRYESGFRFDDCAGNCLASA